MLMNSKEHQLRIAYLLELSFLNSMKPCVINNFGKEKREIEAVKNVYEEADDYLDDEDDDDEIEEDDEEDEERDIDYHNEDFFAASGKEEILTFRKNVCNTFGSRNISLLSQLLGHHNNDKIMKSDKNNDNNSEKSEDAVAAARKSIKKTQGFINAPISTSSVSEIHSHASTSIASSDASSYNSLGKSKPSIHSRLQSIL